MTGAVNKLAGELVDQKKAYEKLKLQLPEKDVNFLLTEKDAIISNLNRQLSTRKEIRGSPQKIGAEENNNTANKSKQESLLSKDFRGTMKENEDMDIEPPQVIYFNFIFRIKKNTFFLSFKPIFDCKLRSRGPI